MNERGENTQTSDGKRSLFTGIGSLVIRVGCLTAGIIVLFLLAGIWIDNKYETGTLFTGILVIISMPITMLAIFRWLRNPSAQMSTLSPHTDKVDQEE